MSTSQDMDNLHREIIESVIKNVRQDFDNMGIDEQVLIDLQELWEQKLSQATKTAIETANAHKTQLLEADSNVATSSQLLTVHSAKSSSSGPLGSAFGGGGARAAASLAQMASFNAVASASALEKGFEGSQILPQPQQQSSFTDLKTTAKTFRENVVVVGEHWGNAPKRIPSIEGGEEEDDDEGNEGNSLTGQFDGQDEDEDEGEEDRHQIGTSLVDDDELGSDLDDDSDDWDSNEGRSLLESSSSSAVSGSHHHHSAANNYIICQYEKVTRTKNKWKCILKDGMLHIDGRDYAFHRANCDYEW